MTFRHEGPFSVEEGEGALILKHAFSVDFTLTTIYDALFVFSSIGFKIAIVANPREESEQAYALFPKVFASISKEKG